MENKLDIIARVLREGSVTCHVYDTETDKRVECICRTKVGTLVAVNYVVLPSGSEVAVRAVGLGTLMDDAFRSEMLRTLNGINRRYKYIRFMMNDDNSIVCSYDIPVRTEGLEDVLPDVHICMMDIIDHSIREILSIAISGADDEED